MTDATFPPDFAIRVVDETGSTNADLLAAAAAGAPHGSVLVARHQTAGRGRLDRRWDAPHGANLLASILHRRDLDPLHRLTQRTAVAAAIACERVAGVSPQLKWPNDLLLDGAKLAGILAETGSSRSAASAPSAASAGGIIDHVVVGVGLNVGWAPAGAARLGDGIDPLDVLAAMLDALASGEAASWEGYRSRLATIGQDVSVSLPVGSVQGRAIDVEPDGRLVVVDARGISHRIATGDVVHLRPAT